MEKKQICRVVVFCPYHLLDNQHSSSNQADSWCSFPMTKGTIPVTGDTVKIYDFTDDAELVPPGSERWTKDETRQWINERSFTVLEVLETGAITTIRLEMIS